MDYRPRIPQLIVNHLHGTNSPAEKEELDQWLDESPENRLFLEKHMSRQLLQDGAEIFLQMDSEAIYKRFERSKAADQRRKVLRYVLYGVAALLTGILIIRAIPSQRPLPPGQIAIKVKYSKFRTEYVTAKIGELEKKQGEDITLTLSDGSNIELNNTNKKKLGQQAGYRIIREDARHLAYLRFDTAVAGLKQENVYNTLYTPKSADSIQLLLPDGTCINIIPGSALYYPIAPPETTLARVVTLHGEALFDIYENPQAPFLVETKNTETEALGTYFLVRDFDAPDNNVVAALTGKVEVSNGNQRKSLSNKEGFIIKKTTDTMMPFRGVVATSGISSRSELFITENRTIGSVMRDISQWYGMVEPVFQGVDSSNRRKLGSGPLPKHLALQTLLDLMSKDGLHFTIDAEKECIAIHP